ncbi:MAG: hypothetical protein Q9181_007205 [Wetmoreana brouardii]
MPGPGQDGPNFALISPENIIQSGIITRLTRRRLANISAPAPRREFSRRTPSATITASNIVGGRDEPRLTRSGSTTTAAATPAMRTVSTRKERRHDPMTQSGRNSRRQRASRGARHAETSRINACSGTDHPGAQVEQQDQDTEMTIGLSTSKDSPRANLPERSEEDTAMVMDSPPANDSQAASTRTDTPAGVQELHNINKRILTEVNLEAVAAARATACPLPCGPTQAQPVAKRTVKSLQEIIEEARCRRSLNVVSPTPSLPPVTTAKRVRFLDELIRGECAEYNEPSVSSRAPLSPVAPSLPQDGKGDTGSQLDVDRGKDMEEPDDKENVYFRVPKKKNCRAKLSWPNGVDAAPLTQWDSSSPPPCPGPPPNSPTPPSPIILPLEPTDAHPALVLQPPSSDDEVNYYQNPKVHVFPPKRSSTLIPRDEVRAGKIETARLKRMEREREEKKKWKRLMEEIEREYEDWEEGEEQESREDEEVESQEQEWFESWKKRRCLGLARWVEEGE